MDETKNTSDDSESEESSGSEEQEETENDNETTQNNETIQNETNEVSEQNNNSDESDDNNEEDAEDSRLLGTKTPVSHQSRPAASQASMVVGSGRQSTLKSQLDIDGAEQTEIDFSKLEMDPTPLKKGKISKIQRYFNPRNEPVYTLSAKAFNQFEDMIFNIMKVDAKNNLNPDDPDLNRITKLADFDKPEFTSAFVPDMKILNQQLDLTVRNHPQLTKSKSNKLSMKKELKDSKSKTKSDHQEIKYEKIITIIVNSSSRPRKLVRILLTKLNTVNFDQIKADICNTLKMEYGTIKKFYTLKGIEVNFSIKKF